MPGKGKKPPKTGWRKYVPSWKIVLGVFFLGVAGVVTLIGVAYAKTPIPTDAQSAATSQQSVIYYSDGKTVLAKFGTPRVNVTLAPKDKQAQKGQVPYEVQEAVVALEDHNFWNESGVSPTGTARAVLSTVFGGQEQGGSTITQQMARNYYVGLSQQRSLSRKFKEILISVRLGNERSKSYILETYLNTVDMGRGTNGIGAAASSFFRKDVSQLNVGEGCLLASMIQQPSYFHTTPSKTDPAFLALQSRWNTCLDDMVKYKDLSAADRAKVTYPTPKESWSDVPNDPQAGYLQQRVMQEVQDRLGMTSQIDGGGYKIVSTFNKRMQDDTAQMISSLKKAKGLNFSKKSGAIHLATATINPATGEVLAAYGGANSKTDFDDAWYSSRLQPGSSMKPYVLATALSQGISLNTNMDGDTPQMIAGFKVNNDSPSEHGNFNLINATANSVNTVFVSLGQKVGLNNVINTAVNSGIKRSDSTGNRELAPNVTLPLGTNVLSPVEQAAGYATFANMGTHVETHVIKSVFGPDGNIPFTKKIDIPKVKSDVAFTTDVARDATYAMESVVTKGTGTAARLADRPAAGKTGTASANKWAWFVGFTPQLSTSVAMFRQSETKAKDGSPKITVLPLQGLPGYSQVYGGQIPAQLWHDLMTKYNDLLKLQPEQFQPPVYGGDVPDWAAASAAPTPSNTPTCSGNGFGRRHQNCANTPQPGTTQSATACISGINSPSGCNPNLEPPTTAPYHKVWCALHPTAASCQTTTTPPTSGPGGNGNGNNNTDGAANATGQSLGLVPERDEGD